MMDAIEELVACSRIQQLVYPSAAAVDGKDLDGVLRATHCSDGALPGGS